MNRTLLSFVLALSACSGSHTSTDGSVGDAARPGPYTGAFVAAACGPADGPAVEVVLYEALVPECSADPERRSMRFYLYGERPAAGATLTSTSDAPVGGVAICPGGSPPCRTSSDFTITFDTYEEEVGATGSYSVEWEPGSTDTGTFDASWCMSTPILCG